MLLLVYTGKKFVYFIMNVKSIAMIDDIPMCTADSVEFFFFAAF